jgi:hypothetical protein
MAQLTIYLDDESLHRIESAAGRENSSVSKWVKNRLIRSLEDQWPADYYQLLGSLADSDLERPSDPAPSADSPRESL